MGSLSTVYERHVGPVQSVERLYLGTAFFLAGAAVMLTAIFAATTDIFTALLGYETWQSWELAGVLAGLGLPATFLGLIIVLPISEKTKKRVVQGSLIALVGVLLFTYSFPNRWHGDTPNYTVWVVLTYAVGCGVTLFYAFRTIATFNQRNNPGGTAVVNVDAVDEQPDDTGSETPSASMGSGAGISVDDTEKNPRYSEETDTGMILDDDEDDEDDVSEEVKSVIDAPGEQHEYHDKYCGSCEHFEYRQTATGMVPHCTYHGEDMEDLDACVEWTPNNGS